MEQKRRRFSDSFKAKVALDAVRGLPRLYLFGPEYDYFRGDDLDLSQ